MRDEQQRFACLAAAIAAVKSAAVATLDGACVKPATGDVNTPCRSPPAKKMKGEHLMLDFLYESDDDETDTSTPQNATIDTVTVDIDKYIRDPVEPRDTDPLVFWSTVGATGYASLGPLAKKLLSVPASSVPTERLFSTAGVVVAKLRSSLEPEMVAKLLFLNKNWEFTQ